MRWGLAESRTTTLECCRGEHSSLHRTAQGCLNKARLPLISSGFGTVLTAFTTHGSLPTIEALNLTKELSSITPAKAIFGSVSTILTTIKASLLTVFYWSVTDRNAPGTR